MAMAQDAKHYAKVKTAPADGDWTGEYLIVNEVSATQGRIFDGSLSTLDASSNYKSVTISADTIWTKVNKDVNIVNKYFTVGKISDGVFSIKSASGLYIANTKGQNSLSTAEKTVYKNTISLSGTDAVITSKQNTKASYLRFNEQTNQNRFRYFTDKSYGKSVCLYKLVEGKGGGDDPVPPTPEPEPVLMEISLSGTPQLSYNQYESFSTQGLKVTATYYVEETDQSYKKDVTSQVQWTIEPQCFEKAEDQDVLVEAKFGNETALEEYHVHVVASPYQLATIGAFSATEGNLNSDISYVADQGDGTRGPAVSSGHLLLYQGSNGVGGYVTVTGAVGVTIKRAVIYVSDQYVKTSIGMVKGDFTEDDYPTKGTEAVPGSAYEQNNINNRKVTFFCLGADKSERLSIDSMAIFYDKVAPELTRLALETTKVTQSFRQNETFSATGLRVWAHYSTGDSIDVTEQVQISLPDMSVAGRHAVTVTYTAEGKPYTATYQIEVVEVDYLFYESFDTNHFTGGNDDDWSNGAGNVSYDNPGWSMSNVAGAKECVKVGTGSGKGSATTPTIALTGTAKLTFRAGAWKNEPNLNVVVTVSDGKISADPLSTQAGKSTTVTLVASQWQDYTLYLSEVTSPVKITFAAQTASKNRFFLDEVVVRAFTPAEVTGITLDGTLNKTQYKLGDTFSWKGLTATALLSNGESLDVTDACEWSAAPATLSAVGENQQVAVTAAYGGKSTTQNYTVSVARLASHIAIEDMLLAVGTTATIEANTTPENAELTYTVQGDAQDIISIEKGVIAALKPGIVQVQATFAGNEEYAGSEVTFNVTVDNYMVASITKFTTTQGAFGLDNAVVYESFRGKGTAEPTTPENCLRLFQGGSYVTLTGALGVTFKQVTITTGKTYDTTVGVVVGNGAAPTSGDAVKKNCAYTVSDLDCDTISFYCLGKDKKSRLDIAAIEVRYTREAVVLDHITLNTDEATTTFVQNTEFSHEGVTVTAVYADGRTQDVTNAATFSTPDMRVAGPTQVTVTYNGMSTSYDINIEAEQVISLSLSGNYRTYFHQYQEFGLGNMVVTATYNTGRTAQVEEGLECTEPDMTQVGTQEVTISYGGVQVSYSIFVDDMNVTFRETFAKTNGTGGNDNQFSGSVASGNAKPDREDWTLIGSSGGNSCIRVGKAGTAGSATTPAISTEGTMILSFRAAGWATDESAISLTATSGTLTQSNVALEQSTWNTFLVGLTQPGESTQITFATAKDANCRFFLDDVKMSYGYMREMSLSASGNRWATICLPQAVAPEDRQGAQFYNIVNAVIAPVATSGEPTLSDAPHPVAMFEVKSIILEEETDTLVAGKPYICNAFSNYMLCGYSGEVVTEPVEALGLVGNLNNEPMTVADGNYLIGGNQFHLVNGATATIGQNRAYIDLTRVPAVAADQPIVLGANQLRFYMDGTIEGEYTSGIVSVEYNDQPVPTTIYNALGQRVHTLAPGQLYLRNGRKMVVK